MHVEAPRRRPNRRVPRAEWRRDGVVDLRSGIRSNRRVINEVPGGRKARFAKPTAETGPARAAGPRRQTIACPSVAGHTDPAGRVGPLATVVCAAVTALRAWRPPS